MYMKKSRSKCNGSKIALVLVVTGALNWLLIGVFNWNLVSALFGDIPWLERLIYILVGLSGVMMFLQCPCKKCKGGSCDMKDMKCGSCNAKDCVCVPASEEIEEIEELEKEEIEQMEEELNS